MAAAFASGSVGTSAAALTAIDLGLSKYGIVIIPDINNSGQIYWRTLPTVNATPDVTAGFAAPTTDGSQLQPGYNTIPPTAVADARMIQVIANAAGQNYSIIVVK